jgi:hypothetical protein
MALRLILLALAMTLVPASSWAAGIGFKRDPFGSGSGGSGVTSSAWGDLATCDGSSDGTIAIITDAVDEGDCSQGGGIDVALCQCDSVGGWHVVSGDVRAGTMAAAPSNFCKYETSTNQINCNAAGSGSDPWAIWYDGGPGFGGTAESLDVELIDFVNDTNNILTEPADHQFQFDFSAEWPVASAVAISDLTAATASNPISMGTNEEWGQTWTWDLPATTTGNLNGLTLNMILDATSDVGNTQQILLVRRPDATGTATLENMIKINNADAEAPVLVGLDIVDAGGGMTSGISMDDTDIVNVITGNDGSTYNVSQAQMGFLADIDAALVDLNDTGVNWAGTHSFGSTIAVTGGSTLTGETDLGTSPTIFSNTDITMQLDKDTGGSNSFIINNGDVAAVYTFQEDGVIALGATLNDDVCDTEGEFWYDTTNNAFEFCEAPSGAPNVLGGTPATGANPTASVGTSAVNGVATTFLRSDGAPALDVGISPIWTGDHDFGGGSIEIENSTVAGLGAATLGRIAIVTNGLDADDCTAGGGSTVVHCMANGSTWEPSGDSGSGGSGGWTDDTTFIRPTTATDDIGNDNTGSNWSILDTGAATFVSAAVPTITSPAAISVTNTTGDLTLDASASGDVVITGTDWGATAAGAVSAISFTTAAATTPTMNFDDDVAAGNEARIVADATADNNGEIELQVEEASGTYKTGLEIKSTGGAVVTKIGGDATSANHFAITEAGALTGEGTATIEAEALTGTVPVASVGADHTNLMSEIDAGIKRGPDATDTHILTTDVAPAAGSRCLEMDTDGSVILGDDSCANLGPGGTTSIDGLAAAGGVGTVAVGVDNEYGQTWTWNTPATTVGALDGLTLAMELDATVDAQTQNILVVERSDGAGTTAMDSLIELNNNEANAVVDAGITMTAAAGLITTAFDINDAQITNAFVTPNATAITMAELEILDGGTRTDDRICMYEATGNQIDCADQTSAQMLAAVSDATGTGLMVFATDPVFNTPNLGTPSAGVLTNATGTAAGLTAGVAQTGDTATAFFAAGTIEHERGGLEADVSGYTDGLYGMAAGVTADIDTEAELETALGGLDVITVTTDDVSSANMLTAISDETGTGVAVFGTSPEFTTSLNVGAAATAAAAGAIRLQNGAGGIIGWRNNEDTADGSTIETDETESLFLKATATVIDTTADLTAAPTLTPAENSLVITNANTLTVDATTFTINGNANLDAASTGIDASNLAATLTFGATDTVNFDAWENTDANGLIIPTADTSCANVATLGQICFEEDAVALWIGDGSAPPTQMNAAAPSTEVRSMYWGAGAMSSDGTGCGAPTEVVIPVAAGIKQHGIICIDGGTIYGSTHMPDGWDTTGDILFTLSASAPSGTETLAGDFSFQCKGDSGAIDNTWATGGAADITFTTTDDFEEVDIGTIDADTECNAGDAFWWRWVVDDATNTNTVASILGVKLEYVSSIGD